MPYATALRASRRCMPNIPRMSAGSPTLDGRPRRDRQDICTGGCPAERGDVLESTPEPPEGTYGRAQAERDDPDKKDAPDDVHAVAPTEELEDAIEEVQNPLPPTQSGAVARSQSGGAGYG